MHIRSQAAARERSPRLALSLAQTPEDVAEAQALRFRVFALELGARLPSRRARLDADAFDAHCDHLIVREREGGEVVGTYRVLAPAAARAAGSLYSESEFDLARLAGLRAELVEAGRSCVHPDHRHGAVITLLWSGLAAYLAAKGCRYLAGCASVSLADGGRAAAAVRARLAAGHAGPAEWRVFPRLPLALEAVEPALDERLPPLVKGYLRAGAVLCGEPAWDPEFDSADFFMLLALDRLDRRYAARFLRESARR